MVSVWKLPASILFLFSAIIVYAIAGSPTPDNPGWPEALIGVLLICSVGAAGVKKLSVWDRNEGVFIQSLQILFFVGLIVPVVTGGLRGNNTMLMIRDVLAFLFLCLPLFLSSAFEKNEQARKFFPWLLVLAGIIFAVRTLVPAFNIWVPQGELLYLSNSPLVLFASLYMVACLWSRIQGLQAKAIPQILFFLGTLGVLLAAMLLDVQRATVMAVIISVAVLWLDTLIFRPRKIILPTILLLLIGYAALPWITEAGEAIYRKTSHVGLNMRWQEVEAVLTVLASDPLGFFIGAGWGGTFASPAVGFVEVNYTHSLLSTMFLKGGIVLLGLTALMCLAALYQVFLIFQRDRGCGLSVFWPLVIPVLLYASHKSLDFGLLLLLIGVWSNRDARLHKAA